MFSLVIVPLLSYSEVGIESLDGDIDSNAPLVPVTCSRLKNFCFVHQVGHQYQLGTPGAGVPR